MCEGNMHVSTLGNIKCYLLSRLHRKKTINSFLRTLPNTKNLLPIVYLTFLFLFHLQLLHSSNLNPPNMLVCWKFRWLLALTYVSALNVIFIPFDILLQLIERNFVVLYDQVDLQLLDAKADSDQARSTPNKTIYGIQWIELIFHEIP